MNQAWRSSYPQNPDSVKMIPRNCKDLVVDLYLSRWKKPVLENLHHPTLSFPSSFDWAALTLNKETDHGDRRIPLRELLQSRKDLGQKLFAKWLSRLSETRTSRYRINALPRDSPEMMAAFLPKSVQVLQLEHGSIVTIHAGFHYKRCHSPAHSRDWTCRMEIDSWRHCSHFRGRMCRH